jgi:ABC-type uncharacterized transport system fused permease/ATPase subunit
MPVSNNLALSACIFVINASRLARTTAGWIPRKASFAPNSRILRLARLSSLGSEIDGEDNWPQGLSGGEQQRLAIARAVLDKPDWLFLDEATSALDEELEAEIYRMLIEVLPNTTIVSIGHRSTLIALHRRHLEMVPREGGAFEPIATIKAEIFGGRAVRAT